jgi:hypothetical protein
MKPIFRSLGQLAAALLAFSLFAAAQQPNDEPVANPGRPSVSTPATLTPVGYLQFETGFLGAWHSPEFSSQSSLNEVVKFSVSNRFQFLLQDEPFARSHVNGLSMNSTGGVSVGVQVVVYPGEGARPTISASYFHLVYGGDAADLDIGSARNSAILLASGDVKGFHYDTNFIVNDTNDAEIHRAQFGQTLSVSHDLNKKFGLTGEIWHFTQPFLASNTVGNLWAVNYNVRGNLVLDAGFNRGLTSTSTRWEVFAGFTYLLPHKLLPH